MTLEIISKSVEQTISIGKTIGTSLVGGEVIGFVGQLGAGKTHMIKGIAQGAAGGEEGGAGVNSPTFVIVNEYFGRLDVYHIDAYRLDSVDDFERLGFDDMCYERSVVLIEWADKVESALNGIKIIKIKISHLDETSRKIEIDNLPDYANKEAIIGT